MGGGGFKLSVCRAAVIKRKDLKLRLLSAGIPLSEDVLRLFVVKSLLQLKTFIRRSFYGSNLPRNGDRVE